jgi:hypothetical protein
MKTALFLLICLPLVASPVLANPVRTVLQEMSAESTGRTHVRLKILANTRPKILKTYGTSRSDWFYPEVCERAQ